MPRYEYECETCHRRFEVQQKFSDPPVERCERCGHSVRKLISAPGLMFKGTGWYVTDYSNKLKDPGAAQREGGDKESAGAKKDGAGGASEGAAAKSESGTSSAPASGSSTPSPSAAPPSASGTDAKPRSRPPNSS